jgi:hypothetical protein
MMKLNHSTLNLDTTIGVWALALIAVFALLAAPASLAQTQSGQKSGQKKQGSVRGYDYEGPYAQLGVSVGQIDFDFNGVDNNASGGFTLTGGYRVLPWISAEANFTYMGGGAVEAGSVDIGDGSFFAFTFGPKIYPLGAFKVEQIPDIVQPYALIQIGGGEFEVDHTSFDKSVFVARFMLGFDIWATDNIGFFVEGGGHATDEDDVDGVGVFTVGGQYRF